MSQKSQSQPSDFPDLEQVATAILATDFYSFVQESFPIVSGGARLLPNWHLEAISYELSRVMKGSTRRQSSRSRHAASSHLRFSLLSRLRARTQSKCTPDLRQLCGITCPQTCQ